MAPFSRTTVRRAFTLIELLVVIAIIGILSALLTGPIVHARARALETTCQNNLRQIAILLMGHLHDRDYFPPATSIAESYFGAQTPLLAALGESLRGASNILFCPRSVKLEQLDIDTELAAGRIGYFYWAWIPGGGGSGVQPMGLGASSNVWLTQGWNSQLGQLVLMTDHFRDRQYWALPQDWQFHAPPDVEHSLSVPGTLAVMQDGSVRKIAPRP
ncbi:MAG TPA: type II secretion system protein [Kiritimatiellia bacterium]|nr:type II secretion system protein [Kiritimatiellia bacterium]